MKTREIEVNVETDWINQTGRIGYISESTKFPTRLNGKETIKAKLIIEIPERKIEITESDLEKIFSEIELYPREKEFIRLRLFRDQP